MLKSLYPLAYVPSVYDIDYAALYRRGYRAILFDIDNTLVPHGAPATPESDALLRQVQQAGILPVMLSNNNEARVESFLEHLNCLYVCDAEKPKSVGYHRALALLELPPGEVLVVGDQVFTDILGANRCGLDSVLVRFIGADTEKKLGKRRRLEQLVLWCYRHSRHYNRLQPILKTEATCDV